MHNFALYDPSSGQYVSYVAFNRKTKQYDIEFTHNLHSIRFWKMKSSAEGRAQRIFDWNRNLALEVREIR